MVLNMARNATSVLPNVEKITSIYKYTDKDGLKPKVNKLNSTAWELKKRQVQKVIS